MKNEKKIVHSSVLSHSEPPVMHRAQEEEYSLYEAVKIGDLDSVRERLDANWFANPSGVGVLSANPLTNIKYHFVISTAFITRFCVEGGMLFEEAYRLSDTYINKMDLCTSKDAVLELHRTMVLDYTNRMLKLRNAKPMSKPVSMCIDYIYNHLTKRITVEELALFTQHSPTYLSIIFKKEMGVSISDYIRTKKIESAQNLLKYSDYATSDIASYLAFSSQSHFIQVFEKQVGMTPKKYKDANYHKHWTK